MGKLNWNSKLGIIVTIVVLVLILIGISERKAITKTAGLDSLTDEEYVSYYKKACKLEDSDACNELGKLYDHGDKEVSIDKEEALTYYGIACNLDNATACNNLAYLYNKGEGGVERHNGYAFRYYKKACDLGDIIGCYNLGSAYYHGEGTKPSKYRAKQLFQKVCDKGIGAGCNDLAYMYAHGIHLCPWPCIHIHIYIHSQNIVHAPASLVLLLLCVVWAAAEV